MLIPLGMAEWCIPFWITFTLPSCLIFRFFLCLEHISYKTANFSRMCLMLDQFLWGHSSRDCDISCFFPASNLGYHAAPKDNFSWVPNCSLGPPECETKVSSKEFWFGLCEIAWFLWQPIANLRRGVCLQNYSYLSCYLS